MFDFNLYALSDTHTLAVMGDYEIHFFRLPCVPCVIAKTAHQFSVQVWSDKGSVEVVTQRTI